MAAPSSTSSSLSFVHQNLFRIQECNFILHLFLSEFSFTLFICVCVPPCDCLVALYLLLFRAIILCLLLFLRITVLLLFTCLFRALILCLLFVSFLLQKRNEDLFKLTDVSLPKRLQSFVARFVCLMTFLISNCA